MRRFAIAAAALVLAGCVTPGEKVTVLHVPAQQWVKSGATAVELRADAGQCREKALTPERMAAEHRLALYQACMEGRGYSLGALPATPPAAGQADVTNLTP